jgi:hypothetical protein
MCNKTMGSGFGGSVFKSGSHAPVGHQYTRVLKESHQEQRVF